MKVFVTALAIAGLVGAAPLDGPQLVKRVPPSQPVFDNLELFGEYSAAGYKLANIAPAPQNSKKTFLCSAQSCPTITASTSKPVIVYSNNMPDMNLGVIGSLNPFIARTGFYVATDTNRSVIVVTFQGTDLFQGQAGLTSIITQVTADFLGGVIAVAEPFDGPNCAGCLVSKSFQDTYNAVRGSIITAVLGELKKPGQAGYRVIFTGHSLGGALAGIAAAQNRANNTFGTTPVDLYSYASARIGNNQFAVAVTNQKANGAGTFRVTHNGDGLTKGPLSYVVPPATANHYGPEYYISTPGNATVTINDIVAIPAVILPANFFQSARVEESTAGVLGSNSSSDPNAHTFYIHQITCLQC